MSESDSYEQQLAQIRKVKTDAVDRYIKHQVGRVKPYGREYPEGENKLGIPPDKDRDTKVVVPENVVDDRIGKPLTVSEKLARDEPPMPSGEDRTDELPRID